MASDRSVDFRTVEAQLSLVFKPATAIDENELFCGRLQQVRAVVDAINQSGQHAILYGEPGVGKTSLANILASRLSAASPIVSPHINCDSGDDFAEIWRRVFSEIEIIQETRSIGFGAANKTVKRTISQVTGALPTPDVIRKALTFLGSSALVYVILDEFDKIPDPKSRQQVADTIKLLSDRSVPATIVLVGVADDVHGLIEDHQSVERCLKQVSMPRMSRDELEEIVIRGYSRVGMDVAAAALSEISGLSKGLPHYAHLLSLHAGRNAIDQRLTNVGVANVKAAIATAVSEAQESIRNVYDKATFSTKKSALYSQVLLACSMAETDDRGNFSPTDVAIPMSRIMGKKYTIEHFARHLHAFCEVDRGPVLRKIGGQYRWRYRFANPLIQPFVLMKGLERGTISEEDLALDVEAAGRRLARHRTD